MGKRLSGDTRHLPRLPFYVFTNGESKSSCWEELLPDDIMGKENTLYKKKKRKKERKLQNEKQNMSALWARISYGLFPDIVQ